MRKLYTIVCLAFLLILSQNVISQVTYNENFDGGLNGWITAGGYNGGTSTTNACAGSSFRVNIYDGDASNTFTSPLLGTSNGGQITLAFDYKVINFTGGGATPNPWGSINVQYATSASGPWTTVHTINASNHTASATCAAKLVNFDPPAGDLYLRFSSTRTDGDFYVYYDNIAITQGAPPACMSPTNLVNGGMTSTGVTVSWDPSGSGSVTGYEWEVRTSGAAGSGATGLTASGTTGVGGLSATVNTLTANTSYSFYVRTNCGSGSFSSWSAYTFTTPCAAITTFPYLQNFDAATMPACWSAQVISGGAYNWVLGTGSAGGDIGASYNGTRFISKSYNTSTANLVSAPMNLASIGANQARISVYVYRHANTVAADVINFHVNTDPNTTGSTIVLAIHPKTTEAPAETASGWYKYTADIPISYNTAGPVYFIIEGITTAGFSSYDLGIEDFVVEQTPSCEPPTGVAITGASITTTTAEVTWNPPAVTSPVDYQIYYSTTNTAPTGSSTPNVTGASSPATITGLTPASTYYVWVRSNCGGTDVSSWSISTSFSTLCNPGSIPTAVESFDAVTMPICWSRSLVTGTTNWAPAASNDGVPAAHTGARFMGKVYTASDALVVSQALNMTTAGTNGARINVWIYRNTLNKVNDRIRFHVNTTTDLTGASQILEIFPLISVAPTVASAGWYNYTADIPASYNTEPVVYIIGQGTTDGTSASYGIGFDDFKVELIPTCNEPTNVIVSNVVANSAQLDWSNPSSGAPTSYQVYYSTSNTAPTGATTPTLTGLTGNTTNLTGLTPGATYYLWMRSFCGGSDVSAWTATAVTFTTWCNSTTAFSEDFNGVTPPALPACWTKIVRNVAGIAALTVVAGNAHSAPNAVEMYNSSSTATADLILVSPPLSNLSAGTHRLRFWARNSSATQDLEIGTLDNNNATAVFTPLQTVDINGTYAEYTVDFTAYSGTDMFIGIRRLSTSTFTYVYIDDINWEVVPTCNPPTNVVASAVTVTDAQVDWVPPVAGTVTNYTWELRTSGAPGSGATGLVATATTTTTTANFTTLTGGTAYTFYIRTNCVNPDVSSYTSVSFFTLPANDECPNAVTLVKNTPVNTSTSGSTQSMPAEACAGFTGNADDDVWFKFTAGYNGGATVTVTQTTIDAVVIVYSGACGAFTSIGCSDLFTPNDEVVTLTGLTAGSDYYVRVYSYSNGAAAMGAFTITVTGSALPVSLTEFRGESINGINKLSWKTVTEVNNKGFELQRSADGKNFSSLAFVATKAEGGNSTAALSYTFNDTKPLGGVNYYRLKQVDNDGKFAFSNTVELKSKAREIMISSIYPNPATRALNLVISTPVAEKVTLVVTDLTGKRLLQHSLQVVSGDNQQQLNIQSLAAGTYLIKAICANGCETAVHRFVKQ